MFSIDRQLCESIAKSYGLSRAQNQEFLEKFINNLFSRAWKFAKDRTGHVNRDEMEVKS